MTVGADGFRSVPLSGKPERILAQAVFDPASLTVEDKLAYFPSGGALWRVPLDGSAPPALVQDHAERLWVSGPRGEIVYSRDPGDRYIGGAGDGWLGASNFMQRGQLLTFTADGARLHFLEHAATVDTVGDLTSVTLPDGAPAKLGLNVYHFDELEDGRVLVLENRVYEGAWNRVVIVDEAAKTKHWVTPATAQFLRVPKRNEVIADVISGASGYDIVRVAVPAR